MDEFALGFPTGAADRAVADLGLAGEQLRNGLEERRAKVDLDRLGGAPDHEELVVRESERRHQDGSPLAESDRARMVAPSLQTIP
jgi:hypothetical protein